MTKTEVVGVFSKAKIDDANRVVIEFDYGGLTVIVKEDKTAKVFVKGVLIASLTRDAVSIIGDTTEVKRCGTSYIVRYGWKGVEVAVAFRDKYTGIYPGEPSCKEKAEVYWEGR